MKTIDDLLHNLTIENDKLKLLKRKNSINKKEIPNMYQPIEDINHLIHTICIYFMFRREEKREKIYQNLMNKISRLFETIYLIMEKIEDYQRTHKKTASLMYTYSTYKEIMESLWNLSAMIEKNHKYFKRNTSKQKAKYKY